MTPVGSIITKSPHTPLIAPIAQSQEALASTNSPNRLIGNKRITPLEADKVMELVADLVTPAYRPKYFKALYRIGATHFLNYAERARLGKYPQHLFRILIDAHK